jgi:protease-4
MEEGTNQKTTWASIAPYLILLAALVLGIFLAAQIPQPIIGTIYLNDAIYAYTARDLIAQIDYAYEHPEIRAVVLILDSPGGTVVDTEAVYLELARLRDRKPVITMVQGMAASGAYYLSVGTDYIFNGPSAYVGNVGVISELPPAPTVFEDLVTTGPYKLSGAPRDTRLRRMEAIKQAFLEAVLLGRGEVLKVDEEIILSGEIWLGSEATRNGLSDEVGSLSDAIQFAADRVKIRNYSVEDLRELADLPELLSYFFFETSEGILTPYPREPGEYLLYIPPGEGRLP